MRAYEFRKYLLRRDFNEADIKNHIENVRRIEKALDKTAESLSSVESVDSQLTWHIVPWKKKELLDSLALYFTFKSSYVKPTFHKAKVNYKECPECGERTPLGSTYCRKCGAAIGATQFKQINEIYDSVEDKWTNHRVAMIGGMAAVAALILAIVFRIVTAFPLPDVVGQDPVTASRMLTEQGTDEQSIHVQCSGSELSESDIAKGEYEVIAQKPEAGRKVHKSTDVTIDCKDLYKERSEAVSDCRYEEASKAEAVAKQYDYKYDEKVLGEDIPEQEKLYVVRIAEQDDDNRTVIYELDSEKNIENWLIGEASEYIGKPAAEGRSLEERIGCDVNCINYEKEEVPYYDDNIDDYQITGVNGFDIEKKELSIAVDTEWHLEELELIAGLKDKIPYEGMPESYIDETGAGKHTTEEDRSTDDANKTLYIWKSADGKYEVLTVACTDGEVTSVYKDYEEAFWQGDLPDYSVDADAIYAEIERAEKEKEEKLEAEAEEYAAAARDRMDVYVTRSGTYHISGCGDLSRSSSYWETTYGNAKNSYHPCLHCNPDTYCERAYDSYKSEYIRKDGKL